MVQYCLSTFSLQVVLKVSDIQVIMEHEHLLLNLHWILSKNTAPTTPVMNAIQFLTKICSQVPRSRAFLRDNLGLASTLTNLLVSLGVNSSSKSSKVLELLRFVSHGISIIRQESYLEKLIVQLLRLLYFFFIELLELIFVYDINYFLASKIFYWIHICKDFFVTNV